MPYLHMPEGNSPKNTITMSVELAKSLDNFLACYEWCKQNNFTISWKDDGLVTVLTRRKGKYVTEWVEGGDLFEAVKKGKTLWSNLSG